MADTHALACCPRWQLYSWLSGSLADFAAGITSPDALFAASRALAALSDSNPDTTILLGKLGIHAQVAKVLAGVASFAPAIDYDTALDDIGAIATAATSALPPGLSFPVRPGADEGLLVPPLVFRFPGWTLNFDAAQSACQPFASFLFRGRSEEEEAPARRCEPGAPAGAARLPPVYARTVPARQTSQDDVGRVLWPSAPVLSRWLMRHGWLLQGRGALPAQVLEIGAGMGLAGIVAGLVGNAVAPAAAAAAPGAPAEAPPGCAVTLTDFEPIVLANLAHNVRLNDAGAHHAGFVDFADRVHQRPGRIQARRLDWFAMDGCVGTEKEEEEEERGGSSGAVPADLHPTVSGYDVILGTDIVCRDEDADAILTLLRRYLTKPRLCGGLQGEACGQPRHEDDCSSVCSCVGGVAVLLLPPPSARFGVERLLSLLDAAAAGGELAVKWGPVPQEYTQVQGPDEELGDESCEDHSLPQHGGPLGKAGGTGEGRCWCSCRDCPLPSSLPLAAFRDGDDPAAVTAGGHEAKNVLIFVKWGPAAC